MTRLALLLLAVSGCAEPSAPPATAEVPPAPSAAASGPAPRETAPPTASAAPEADGGGKWEPGRKVTALGRVSKTPNQHMVGHVDGKQPEYFDLERGDQTIVHVAKPITCPGLVSVTGTVFEVRGSSKRPGSKVDDSYAELQLDVTDARCVP